MTPSDQQHEMLMDADELHAFMEDAFGYPMNWTIEQVDGSGVRVRQPTGAANARPGGTVSGPTLMTLADAAAYLVLLSRIGPQALAVTSNLNINFLRRPDLVDLVAEASLLKLGRSLALAEVTLWSDRGEPTDAHRPVAHATITYSLALVGGTDAGDTGAAR